MTIAVAVKVGDGVVLGSDSASTLAGPDGVINVYFNAEKIVNLVKGLPLGMIAYGLGGLSGRSVTALAKDLRRRLSSADPKWRLDPTAYSVESVASKVVEFFYEEHYRKEYPRKATDSKGVLVDKWDVMGFFVVGFSADSDHSEVWAIEIDVTGKCQGPQCILDQGASGSAVWAGAPEALNRLIRGVSSQVRAGLISSGISAADVDKFLGTRVLEPLVVSGMPIQDAIDLAKYMVDVTIGFVRFAPGAPTVAEPVDIAAITKHEGFRWVRRKHYYSLELNPGLPVIGSSFPWPTQGEQNDVPAAE